jgi:hypothetical protein
VALHAPEAAPGFGDAEGDPALDHRLAPAVRTPEGSRPPALPPGRRGTLCRVGRLDGFRRRPKALSRDAPPPCAPVACPGRARRPRAASHAASKSKRACPLGSRARAWAMARSAGRGGRGSTRQPPVAMDCSHGAEPGTASGGARPRAPGAAVARGSGGATAGIPGDACGRDTSRHQSRVPTVLGVRAAAPAPAPARSPAPPTPPRAPHPLHLHRRAHRPPVDLQHPRRLLVAPPLQIQPLAVGILVAFAAVLAALLAR